MQVLEADNEKNIFYSASRIRGLVQIVFDLSR